MVDLHRFVVGVIVRQIGTGHDQRVFIFIFALDELRQSHTQRAAAFVTLISHDDGHEFEIAQHPLQPRQLHLERMLSALFGGSVPLAGEFDSWTHLHELLCKRLVDWDCPQRRRISIAVIDGSEIKGLVVRRRNHDHARKLPPFQRSVGVGSDGARELIAGVRCNHSEDRVGDRRLRRSGMRQHVIHHRRKCLCVGWIEATGDTRLSHVLRIGRTDVPQCRNRRDRDE